MSMTKREYLGKQEVHRILAEQGYPTYAHLFDMFDLHLTNDPDVIGYMIPSKAVITVNENLDLEQVSVIVRHEILHEYLNHAARMEKHTGTKNLNPAQHQNFNIAGDYEISNLGYTEGDKKNIRHIVINGVKLSGLVTEDDHPDWVGLSVEEMYDKLEEERAKSDKEMVEHLNNLISHKMVIVIANPVMDNKLAVMDNQIIISKMVMAKLTEMEYWIIKKMVVLPTHPISHK